MDVNLFVCKPASERWLVVNAPGAVPIYYNYHRFVKGLESAGNPYGFRVGYLFRVELVETVFLMVKYIGKVSFYVDQLYLTIMPTL